MLHPPKDNKVVSWSDASYREGPNGGIAKLRYILTSCSSGSSIGGVCMIPQWFLGLLPRRGSQILVAELIAPMVMIFHEHRHLKGTSGIVFVDNMAALCALATGASKVADVDALSFASRLWLLKIACDLWYEYVASASNISDGGSRIGVQDKLAASAGISFREVSFPAFPDWRTAEPAVWTNLLVA